MMFGGTSSDVTVGVADADGDGDKKPDRSVDRRGWLGVGGAGIGALGFAIAMTVLFDGARAVESQGGFCASGGPYVIAHQCTSGETRQILFGIVGIMIFGGLFVGATSFADGPVLAPSGLLWAGLFGSLGAGFLTVPKGGGGSQWFVGILFIVMGAAGLWPAITQGASWIRRGGNPDTSAPSGYQEIGLVKASVPLPPQASTVQASGDATPAVTGKPAIPSRIVLPRKDEP